MILPIIEKDRNNYNKVVSHPLQSYEWGEFREKTGIKVIRRGVFKNGTLIDGFQLTIHPIPHTKFTIGYLPKGNIPTEEVIEELSKIGREENCIFIQLEPNMEANYELGIRNYEKKIGDILHNSRFIIQSSAHPLFTKFTFQLNLKPSEDELLKNMHPKTRYNIKVAQKHHVEIIEDNSEEAFETYWKLMEETTQRQHFFAHTKEYHQAMWETLKASSGKRQAERKNELTAHLFIANYTPSALPLTLNASRLPLAAWILFTFHKTLYYPYGASSGEYRNVMASNLMMWEAIRFGKKLGLETFDMWGSLGENPDIKDPWYGFHRLKQGYGPKLVEFVGSYDLIINPMTYNLYKGADKLRWVLLKVKR